MGAVALATPSLGAQAAAIIDNGVIQLGVGDTAQLNVRDGSPSCGGTSTSPVANTTTVGLRYLVNGCESTSPGSCECEGWGVSYKPGTASTVSGYANDGILSFFPCGGPATIFTSTPSTARSVVRVCSLQVTHDFKPSSQSPNLYEVNVTLRNLSSQTLSDVRYRRVMDWDVEPTAFRQYITLASVSPPPVELLASCDNGYMSSSPLAACSKLSCGAECIVMPPDAPPHRNVYDSGPRNHGALFDFGFGSLAGQETRTFRIHYGAAADATQANNLLTLVGAQVWSLAKCDPLTAMVCTLPGGAPNTFLFAFTGMTPAKPTPTTTAATTAPTTTTTQSQATTSTSQQPFDLGDNPPPTPKAPATPPVGHWPMDRADPAHHAAQGTCPAATAPWRTPITAAAAPVVLHCLVLAGDGDAVSGFDAVTGERLWRTALGAEVLGLALAPYRAYVGTAAGLHALATDGVALWGLHLPGGGAPSLANGTLVASGPRAVGIEELTGQLLWAHRGDDVRGAPALDGRRAVMAGPSGIVAFDRGTGRVLWRADGPATGSAVVADGVAYLAAGAKVLAVDVATGREVWNATLPGTATATPALYNGTLLIGSIQGMHALAAHNGSLRWSFPSGPVGAAAAAADGMVYFGSQDGRVYAVGETGSLVWASRTGGPVRAAPALAGAMVYVASTDGYLYAIDAATGASAYLPDIGPTYTQAPPLPEEPGAATPRGCVACTSAADPVEPVADPTGEAPVPAAAAARATGRWWIAPLFGVALAVVGLFVWRRKQRK